MMNWPWKQGGPQQAEAGGKGTLVQGMAGRLLSGKEEAGNTRRSGRSGRGMDWRPGATITRNHKLSSLKQQFSKLWRSRVQNQSDGGLGPSRGRRRAGSLSRLCLRSPLLPSSCLLRAVGAPVFLGLGLHNSGLRLPSPHGPHLSAFLYPSSSSSLPSPPFDVLLWFSALIFWFRTCPNPEWPHLKILTSTKTLFRISYILRFIFLWGRNSGLNTAPLTRMYNFKNKFPGNSLAVQRLGLTAEDPFSVPWSGS